jgi:hypothetical protein
MWFHSFKWWSIIFCHQFRGRLIGRCWIHHHTLFC